MKLSGQKRLASSVVVALVTLGLTACGGGSSTDVPVVKPTNPNAPATGAEGVEISVDSTLVREGNGNLTKNNHLTFVIKASQAPQQDITVSFTLEPKLATENEDYIPPANNQVVIPAGQTQADLNIEVIADNLLEADETVLLTLTSASNGATLVEDHHQEVVDKVRFLPGKRSAWGSILNDEVWRGRLNDTGVDYGLTANVGVNADCSGTHAEKQDCSQGFDANPNENSNGDGRAGFKFTKLDSNGNDLPADAQNWDCVRDERTGLIWEVKTNDGGLRDAGNPYSRYNRLYQDTEKEETDNRGPDNIYAGFPDGLDNTIGSGTPTGKSNCGGPYNICTTSQFVHDVNHGDGICGYKDWRVPSFSEANTIVDYKTMALDANYFPHSSPPWTNTPKMQLDPDGRISSNTVMGFVNGSVQFRLVRANKLDLGDSVLAATQTPVRTEPAEDTLMQYCSPAIPASTPTQDFEFNPANEQGTVRHKPTGLIWQRCPEQFTYHDNGTPTDFSDDRCDIADRQAYQADHWDIAAAKVSSPWRLPNIKEAASIMEQSCYLYGLNTEVFPLVGIIGGGKTPFLRVPTSTAYSGSRSRFDENNIYVFDFYYQRSDVTSHDYGATIGTGAPAVARNNTRFYLVK